MFKYNEAPVSLFSFQDIITTLTGIMLLFLLVMALIMIQVNSELQKNSPVYEQLQQARKENNALKADITQTEQEISSLRKRKRELQKRDNAQLKLEKFTLEQQVKQQKHDLEVLKKKIAEQQKKKENLNRRQQELARQHSELEQKKKDLDTIKKRIDVQKDQGKELHRKIKAKRNSITITTGSDTNKQPLVIECSGDFIRVIPKDKTRIRKFERRTPVSSDMVKESMRYIRTFPASMNYYILLIKPSAVPYSNFILKKLRGTFPKMEYGMEPILENEELF